MSYLPNPNGLRFSANMGLSPGVQPMAAPPPDPRTAYTGGLSYTAPQAYGQAGNANNASSRPMLGPQYNPVSNTELAGHSGFSGYYPTPALSPYNPTPPTAPPETWFQHPNNLSITQLQPFKQTGFANVTNKVAAAQPMMKPPEPTQSIWGGGFGKSDNSAWGNALGPTLEQRQGLAGQFSPAANQPSGHTNQALPPGYGSVFGLGAGGK